MQAALKAQATREIDEGLLVRRSREGDQEAFAALYRRHVGRIYALCLRMAGDEDDAASLTQGAFIRAWEKLDTFQERSRFGTWLFRLAMNMALDHCRRRTRRLEREVGVGGSEELARLSRGASAPRAGDRMDLEKAVAALPPGARTAFVLHDVEGFRHEEIAEMSGVTPGTIKAQLHRARRLLREALEQ